MLLVCAKGESSKTFQGLIPRGIIEDVPKDMLTEFRSFADWIWRLCGRYKKAQHREMRDEGLLLPCSLAMTNALWGMDSPKTHLWSSSAVEELAHHCCQLRQVKAGDPTGRVVQAQYGARFGYLFMQERPDRRVDDMMDDADPEPESFRQYLKRKYDCQPECANDPMWQVQGSLSAQDTQRETFLIPAVTDALHLECSTVDALHRAVPAVLRAGLTKHPDCNFLSGLTVNGQVRDCSI